MRLKNHKTGADKFSKIGTFFSQMTLTFATLPLKDKKTYNTMQVNKFSIFFSSKSFFLIFKEQIRITME